MVSIKWCWNNGLTLTNPNQNISRSYLHMAEESLRVLSDIKNSDIWKATTSYYIFYYSLYAIMIRIGVKSEIHTCSIEFMKKFLKDIYDREDIKQFENAFSARINLQYFTDRPIDKKAIIDAEQYCKKFYLKTRGILANITNKQIDNIRVEINAEKYNSHFKSDHK